MQRARRRLISSTNEPVSRFTQPPLIVEADDSVVDAARLMRDKQVGSIIVAEGKTREPLGILTEWDLLSRVIAEGKNASKTRVREVMSAPLVKINAEAKVGDALRIMINRGIRRIAVMEGGVLVGTLAQTQIVGNRRRSSAALPIVEPIKGHQCPYCNLIFRTRRKLSEHLDNVHIETLMMEEAAREEE